MDAHQDRLANPFGFDTECPNCPELCAARDQIVHGYGKVDADLLIVGESPSPSAEQAGIPFMEDPDRDGVLGILRELGFIETGDDAPEPALENCYITYLARCRHPDRAPTDEEIRMCDPFLTAEIRMINPELILPVGDRVLRTLAAEYTTHDPSTLAMDEVHAQELRGRGFEFLPLQDPRDLTESARKDFIATMERTLGRDYRQPKGRRGRAEREHESR